MLDLNIKIEKNNHYINYWNIFSKLLLLKNNLKENFCFLIIVENEKKVNNYLKIWDFLNTEIFHLNNFSDFVELYYNKNWKYIVEKEIFSLNISNLLNNKNIFSIKLWDSVKIDDITKKLNDFWYKFSEYENQWTFKVFWDVISYTNLKWITTKISLWWDNIEEILVNDHKINEFFIWKNISLYNYDYLDKINLDILRKNEDFEWLIVLDSIDFYSSYYEINKFLNNNYIVFNLLSLWEKYKNLGIDSLYIEKIEDLKNILEEKWIKKVVITKNRNTINNFLELNNLTWIKVIETNLTNLKSFKTSKEYIIADDNISRIFIKKRVKRSMSKNLDLMLQITPWDYVVHIDHWIWVFSEIVKKELLLNWWKNIIKKEYIEINYKNNDKLFVPITEVSRVSKYVWVDNPKLTWLNTKEWGKKLQKVSEDVEKIAKELLELYAKRKLTKWYKFNSYPKEETLFFNSFDFTYTDDQINIIKEIYKDMESENPMDRLLSWDVWFWKTEIAFASIYKSIINWKQSALISPLVVLAYEHYEKALDRFKDFPINISVITRFEKQSVIKEVLKKLKEWKIDLIIGTHRLLSEDVIFKDLWLLVVDEEHKFWVKDKEKIKKFKWNIDILSMSATPIPRSLNMALNWLKSSSMLTTPPVGRQAINTIVVPFEDDIIYEAWKRELDRWGQIFFIHNRVENIEIIWKKLSNIFIWKKIIIAHWQLHWDKLEKRIIEFKNKKYDILLATTVIENGIDFSNVNTIFINDAQNFWISQIHQLRWRVWRSDKKWYCYLLFKKDKIKEDAAKRLKTIVDYSHLWAWFELAIKDLEIRWWWDILGIRQSGQWHEIWINLFLEMLEDKIDQMKNNFDLISNKKIISYEKINQNIINNTKKINTTIDLNIPAYVDEIFFWSELDKLNFYREIESLENIWDLENLIFDFKEINNDLPIATNNFFDLLKLKLKAREYFIISIKSVWINYQIDFDKEVSIHILKKLLSKDIKWVFRLIDEKRIRILKKNFENEQNFIKYLLQIFFEKKCKIKLKKI